MKIFELTADDFSAAKKFVRSGAAGHMVVRAMALILRHKGLTRAEAADSLDITPRTVTNICSNYDELGFDRSLVDDPRPGQPPVFDNKVKAKIVAMVCSDPPDGFDRWTLVLIREECISREMVDSISKEQIRIILQEHDLKPWQQKMWCIPDITEEYINRMEAILDLYDTPDTPSTPLVCIDEKPVVLFEDKRAPILMDEGSPKKVDYEYIRNGSCNVFFAVEPFQGKYYVKPTESRNGAEFATFLAEIANKYKTAKTINLVMDNLSTHTANSLVKTFGEKKGTAIWNRFTVYLTPKHGSWLNQAEIAIGMYSRQCLGKARIANIENLKKK